MTAEDHLYQRLYIIAQMAATLEAGDRVNEHQRDTPDYYVKRATRLFNAVDNSESGPVASGEKAP